MAAVLVLKRKTSRRRSACRAPPSTRSTRPCERQSIAHAGARHVEGASHMAEGYTRAQPAISGVHRHLAGRHRHDHGLYSASADSIPILCITGQAPRARLWEDFRAVDIESMPVIKRAVTVREAGAGAARAAAGLSPDALAAPGAGGPALRSRADGRDRISISTPTSPCRCQPRATRKQVEGAGRGASDRPDRGRRRRHQRRRVRAAGGAGRADRRAGHPHADGLGRDSRPIR